MNYIIPYNATKGDPINLDLIVSITTLENPAANVYTIRFYTTSPEIYFDWVYKNKEYTGEREYKRVISKINPPEDY